MTIIEGVPDGPGTTTMTFAAKQDDWRKWPVEIRESFLASLQQRAAVVANEKLSPVALAEACGLIPDEWQRDLLNSQDRQVILNCSRQSGPGAHLVRRSQVGQSYHVDEWPISECSLDAQASVAEPRNILSVKSLPAGPDFNSLLIPDFELSALEQMAQLELRQALARVRR